LERDARRGGAFPPYRDINAFALAGQGKKLDMLKKNHSVGFEFDIDYESI